MINFEKKDNIDIVTFSVKKINAFISGEIQDQISRVFENAGSRVIIDLKGVEYIDSTGFGCFLSLMKTARNNYGIMKFASPQPKIMDLFKALYLYTVFEIFEDTESCIRSFR